MIRSISSIAADYPGTAYDGTPTFAGALRKYFVEYDAFGNEVGISKDWHGDTPQRYIYDYERRLIPAMVHFFGADKPLHSYTADDFERVLEYINEGHNYVDSTLLHYRNLLWVVYQAGFEHELYPDNIFWGDIQNLLRLSPDEQERHRAKVMTRIRKSFSVEEEYKLAIWFMSLDPRTVSGEDLGLLLMFFQGLRNNEACGANYGFIKTISKYGNIPIFDMLQSTEIGSNEVKAGGKTRNAPRILPLFSALYVFLMKRRAFLEHMVLTGEIVLPASIKSVDQLPIVCVGNNYTVRAKSRHLTIAGRKLFDKIGVNKSELAVLQQMIFSQEFKEAQIDEREPTTYLFRRHLATLLYHLGFSVSEIQYWIGHEIEDPDYKRSDFVTDEALYNLAVKFEEYHPFQILLGEMGNEGTEINNPSFFKESVNDSSCVLSFDVDGSHSQYVIDIKAVEPQQPIWLQVKGSPFEMTIDVTAPEKDYLKTVDIRCQKQAVYRKLLAGKRIKSE